VTLRAAAADVPRVEALLTLAGAEAISLHDAADDPVLEPEPDTTPLWPHVSLRALFAADADIEPLCALLRSSCAAEAVSVTALDDADWRAGMEQTFAARPIGSRLWLAPAGSPPAPAGRTKVELNMGVAFGTGEHPTTALCLEWLEANTRPGSTFLDYGCGSGILALTALALGARCAWACDNDPQAIAATRANAALNDAGERLFVGAPAALPAIAVDVLAANILAGPLVALAPTLLARVRVGGIVVLSGMLPAQTRRVTTAYAARCADFEETIRDGWVRLTARRNS
jgi:ribosomal protein L11 methyltransferase